MLETICQWFLLLYLVVVFFKMVHDDFQPRGKGYSGFVASVTTIVISALFLLGAGAFDQLLGPK